MYRFKLSARLQASWSLLQVTLRSTGRSIALAMSSRGTPHDVQLRSHPVWQRLRGFPASPVSGLAPNFQIVRVTGALPPRARFVFAPAPGVCQNHHGIKQRGYADIKPGLVRCLPLARSELNYEHYAPQSVSTGCRRSHRLRWRRGALARHPSTKVLGVGAPRPC